MPVNSNSEEEKCQLSGSGLSSSALRRGAHTLCALEKRSSVVETTRGKEKFHNEQDLHRCHPGVPIPRGAIPAGGEPLWIAGGGGGGGLLERLMAWDKETRERHHE